jgi:Family of unknown function (DUF6525)
MGNASKWHGARASRRRPYDKMAVFDALPKIVRDALNYAAVEFSPAACASMCKRYSAAQVVTFIQQEDMKLINMAVKQKDALADLAGLWL